jgi:hypothetical protein
MIDKSTFADLNKNSKQLCANVAFDTGFYLILAAVVFLSYGYEIFNFNLTIDEEIHAINSSKWNEWIAQGRWGMAFLNYFLLPNPITPVVSIFLGVIGTVIGLMFFIKDSFKGDRVDILAVTALAITTPTLAFTFTFNTLAYGVGCAFLAISIGNSLIYRRTWLGVLIACVLSAFAISIYQTFVFVLAMFVIVHVWRAHIDSNFSKFVIYRHLFIYLFASLLIYFMISSLVLKVASLDIKYVGQFVDLKGFIENPQKKILTSISRVFDIFRLHPGLFGLRSVWLSVVLLISIIFSIAYPLFNKDYLKLLRVISLSLAALVIIVCADAIAQGGAPLRSVIYIPIAITVIVGVAFSVTGVVGRRFLLTLCLFSIVGNSMVNNHLFASSVAAEFRDKMLAEAIIRDVHKLAPSKTDYDVLKVEVIGNRQWPVTGIQSKTETFGASFFEWDGGNRYRIAAYLNLNGLATIGATEEERVRVYAEQKNMPAWPHAGWNALSGDVLILKFGDYSVPQKTSLCSQGIAELCN